MKRAWIPGVLVAAAAVLAWLAWHPPAEDKVASAGRGGETRARVQGSAGGFATRTPSYSAPLAAASRERARAPTLFGEYLKATNYRGLYDRLASSPEGETAEGRLVRYQLLRDCANVTDDKSYRYRGWRPGPSTRDEFVAGIAMTDPNRDRRIAAYDAFNANRCGTLSEVTIAYADLKALLQGAAAAGDPRARAVDVEQQLWESRRESGGSWIRDGGVTVSDAQFDTLKQAASSRDPEAIRVTGRVLSNSWSDYALRVGADQEPVDPRPFVNAWLVLACEYGAPCGADTPRMQQACAYEGRCDAQSFPDYLSYYQSSPYDSQLLARYRGIIRDAIESGNWSQIQLVRGQAPAVQRPTFLPGPR
jgi:hypothetical protein